jgi:hypothetical protein
VLRGGLDNGPHPLAPIKRRRRPALRNQSVLFFLYTAQPDPNDAEENTRPSIPLSRFNTPALQELLRICWHKDPFVRPPFSKVVKDLKHMRKSFCGPSSNPEDIPSPRIPDWQEAQDDHTYTSRPSPDMHPIPLPGGSPRELILLAG